jgi:hypothetical protein
MNEQEIIWAIEGHAVNARRTVDAGGDPQRELVRIKGLIEEYFAAERQRTSVTMKARRTTRPAPVIRSRAGVPYRYDIMPHVLAVLADGRVCASDVLREQVAGRMGLSRQQRLALRPGSASPTPEFTNEHAWALVYLQDPSYTRASYALIINLDPGGDAERYQISAEGLAAHKAHMTFESQSRRRSQRARPQPH